jgi:hypothetical protein
LVSHKSLPICLLSHSGEQFGHFSECHEG